jgi:hypothetical protein
VIDSLRHGGQSDSATEITYFHVLSLIFTIADPAELLIKGYFRAGVCVLHSAKRSCIEIMLYMSKSMFIIFTTDLYATLCRDIIYRGHYLPCDQAGFTDLTLARRE